MAEAARYLGMPASTLRFWACRSRLQTPRLLTFTDLAAIYVRRCARYSDASAERRTRRLKWKGGAPVRFYPLIPAISRSRTIVIDPRIAFGRPVVARTGVRTYSICERLESGEAKAAIRADYGLTRAELRDAVLFERGKLGCFPKRLA